MVLPITDLQLFQFLKEKMGEKEAEALVTFVESKVKESVSDTNQQNLKVLATKEDVTNINQKIADLRTEFKTDIGNLEVRFAKSHADIIKWMFIFWIGSVGVLSGIMITLVNIYIKH